MGSAGKILRFGRLELDAHEDELAHFGIPLFVLFNTQNGTYTYFITYYTLNIHIDILCHTSLFLRFAEDHPDYVGLEEKYS